VKKKTSLTNLNLLGWLNSRLMVIVRDEENFEEKTTLKLTYMRIFVGTGLILIAMFGVSFLMVTTFLNKWFDPRTEYLETDRTLLELHSRVDSLIYEMEQGDRFFDNFQDVVSGEVDFATFESAPTGKAYQSEEINLREANPVDSAFRREFEDADYEQLNLLNSAQEKLNQLFLFSPLNGIISQKFNVKDGHFGIDIVAKKDEPIKVVADGTVILASWTQDSGHVIAVQHKDQLISFYKHNSVLLKEVGETVNAGDIVALIGNSGELTDGPHLHFELWYEGSPVNPEDFIAFE